jgi:tetratricopeptide (TPR) repeat protein
MERLGEARNDNVALLLGHVYHGITRFNFAEFGAATALLNKCHDLNSPSHRAACVGVTAEDPYVMVLSWLALALTTLGYVDQGRERIAEAMSTADHLKQPYSRGFALVFACATAWTTGSAHEEQRYADELIALSTEHGFFYLLAFGRFHRGFALTTLGLPRDGLSAMAESLSMFQAIGAVTCTPWIFVMQADAYAKLGQPQEAFDCLAKAAKTIESTNERYTEPELHRVRGDLLNSTDDSVAAEKDYRLALAVAQRQSSKLCELRAATRLARLWRDQGKRIEARDLLAPVYGWFTEGFDTRDLKEAKALLGELMTTNSKATFLWPGTSVRRKAAVLPGSRCAPCYSCDASTARCGKMRRRQLIALLGGAAVAASPFRARAQRHERPRRLGVLMSNAESDPLGQARIAALRAGLRELGWSEGGNHRRCAVGRKRHEPSQRLRRRAGAVCAGRHRYQWHSWNDRCRTGDALDPNRLCGGQ